MTSTQRIHYGIARHHPYSFQAELLRNYYKNNQKFLFESLEEYFLEDIQKDEYIIYICAPLKATAQKSGKEHILDALKAASQIAGSKYKDKRIVTWIPHLHAFSVFNEILDPSLREIGIDFVINIIKKIKPILGIMDGRISYGMQQEINLAQKLKLPYMPISQLKRSIKQAPSENEANKIFQILVNFYPKNILNHPEFNKLSSE